MAGRDEVKRVIEWATNEAPMPPVRPSGIRHDAGAEGDEQHAATPGARARRDAIWDGLEGDGQIGRQPSASVMPGRTSKAGLVDEGGADGVGRRPG